MRVKSRLQMRQTSGAGLIGTDGRIDKTLYDIYTGPSDG